MPASLTQPVTDRSLLPALASPFIDLLFPSECVSCGKQVRFSDSHICPECLSSITQPEDSCSRCCAPLSENGCGLCTERAFYPDRNICVAEYTKAMKSAMRAYKFRGFRSLSAPLSLLCHNALLENDIRAELITCVPMRRSKKHQRGFNQSELIARRLSKYMKIPFAHTLHDRGGSAHQREQGFAGRFLNAIGRYEPLKKSRVSGKSVIIVDDVFTTGATINECSRILRLAGANRIFSLTLARTAIKRLEIF
jgi:ComF family protein